MDDYIYYSYRSFNDEDRHEHKIEDLENAEDTYINLKLYVDDFLEKAPILKLVRKKVLNYYINIDETYVIKGYNNLFNTLKPLSKYKDSILGINLTLRSKVGNKDFSKLTDFLQEFEKPLDLRLYLGNLNIFSDNQLVLLRDIGDYIDTKVKYNQKYSGGWKTNNENDNIFSFDELIETNKKINQIVKRIPTDYNDIEKVLFIYKYLGKKVHYDNKTAKMEYDDRPIHDNHSIYNVLFKNKGVCSSIATAFKCLMDELNIECQTIDSEGHEWNVVKINNFWYHLDLTWDLDNIKHNRPLEWFLKSESFVLKDDEHQFYTFYAYPNEIAKKSISSKVYSKTK